MKGEQQKGPEQIPLSVSLKFIRALFYLAHLIVPLAALFVAVQYYHARIGLSWEFLALLAFGLSPFLLVLLKVYVAKLGVVEMSNWSSVIPGEAKTEKADAEAQNVSHRSFAQTASADQPIPEMIPVLPSFDSLTKNEVKMLRTLWWNQRPYIQDKKSERWGFGVPKISPDYPQFVNAFSTLAERGLVQQDARGLVFLTNTGIKFGQIYAKQLAEDGDRWKEFAPV